MRIPLAQQLEALAGDPTRGVLPEYADDRALLHEVVGRLRYPPIATMLVSRVLLPE